MSTRNAMRYYVENGYSHWKGTLTFLDLIAKWWNILNIKSPSKGKRKRDPDCEKISAENYVQISQFFSKIVVWINNWKSSGKPGLSDETFKTFKQTSSTIPLLAEYLILEVALEYVLTGKLQSDFLERRFGRYRQLSGANYFATERQFLEAEKSIRIKSLIKSSGYSINDVQSIMKTDKNACESDVNTHADAIMDIISEDVVAELLPADKNIVYYVVGFVARSLTKQLRVQKCTGEHKRRNIHTSHRKRSY